MFAQPGDSRLQRDASAGSERPSRATCHGYMIADRTSTDQASTGETRAPVLGIWAHTSRGAAGLQEISSCRRTAGSQNSFESLPSDCLTG